MTASSLFRSSASVSWIVGSAACLVVAVSACAWFVGIAPAQAAAAKVGVAELRLAQAEVALEKARRHRDEIQSACDALGGRASESPAPGRLDRRNERLAGLLRLAESVGLEVLRIDPGPPVSLESHGRVGIELEAVGGYADHHRFLGELHEQGPDLLARGFRLGRRGDGRLAAGYQLDWIVSLDSLQTQPGERP